MDPVSDPSGEGLQKIVDGLKRTHRLGWNDITGATVDLSWAIFEIG